MNNLKNISQKLGDKELDAMMLISETNRFYATGFHSSAGIVVVTKDQNYLLLDSRYIEAGRESVSDARVLLVGNGVSYTDLINQIIIRHDIDKMGFEENNMTYGEYTVYSAKLSAELVPAQAIMVELRARKDEKEIEKIMKAQHITERVFYEMLSLIKAGKTEKELANELDFRMLANGADGPAFDTIVLTGKNTSKPHGVPGNTVVREGDFVLMDFGCKVAGYCSDMTRTVAVGYATEEMREIYQCVLDAQLAAIPEVKAGAVGKDVDHTARKIITDAGYGSNFGHSLGHSLGVEIHESPNLSPSEETALPVGAVITVEPGIYLPGKFGVRIEDMVVVRESGNINITNAPKNLIIV